MYQQMQALYTGQQRQLDLWHHPDPDTCGCMICLSLQGRQLAEVKLQVDQLHAATRAGGRAAQGQVDQQQPATMQVDQQQPVTMDQVRKLVEDELRKDLPKPRQPRSKRSGQQHGSSSGNRLCIVATTVIEQVQA